MERHILDLIHSNINLQIRKKNLYSISPSNKSDEKEITTGNITCMALCITEEDGDDHFHMP